MTEDGRLALEVLGKAVWLTPHGEGLAGALLAEGSLAWLEAGRWAQAEGDEQAGMLVVIDGVLDLYCEAPGDRELRFNQIGAGAALGQSASFGGGPRLVTAVCVEPSLLLRVSDAGLERIARSQPQIWRAMASLVYLQLRFTLHLAAGAIALPPRQRLAERLLMLSRTRPEGASIRLSQQALAELVGLTRKTVNGYLADFQRQGLVALDYGQVFVLDSRRLQRIAEA